SEMAKNLWYGFYFPDDNTYYPFAEEALPKAFRKMRIGQTLPMLWDNAVWDAQCVIISSKEAVDLLIEDLIMGVTTLESLKLDDKALKKTTARGAKTPKRKMHSVNKRSGKRTRRNDEERNDEKENNGFSQNIANSSKEEAKRDDVEIKKDENESNNNKTGIDNASPVNTSYADVEKKNDEKECSEEESGIRDSSGMLTYLETVESLKSEEEDQKDVKRDEQRGESLGYGTKASPTVMKKKHADENVLRYREAARKLTEAEDEYEESVRTIESKMVGGLAGLNKAREYHQKTLLALSDEQRRRELTRVEKMKKNLQSNGIAL
ncbi:hypothetical protein PRIPAC_96410, partial [Pristionchus pacificus]|uniref:Uncharacterized protein n=1 Tax=Pristionchus pacificus TaxID=54126 RepID=A0A2A6B349_PRIPA